SISQPRHPSHVHFRYLVARSRWRGRRRRAERRHWKLAMKLSVRIHHRGAFTLTELVVVLVIMGIMAAMIIPQMQGTYEDALLRSSSRKMISALRLTYAHAVSKNQTCRPRLLT